MKKFFDSIKRLAVRGAPAIGCAAALGLAAVAQHSRAKEKLEFINEAESIANYLAKSRPTAVNLFWALDRCLKKLKASEEINISILKELLIQEWDKYY